MSDMDHSLVKIQIWMCLGLSSCAIPGMAPLISLIISESPGKTQFPEFKTSLLADDLVSP